MTGTLNASITGHTANISSYVLTFQATAADTAAAQTLLNGVKTFLSGSSTIDNVQATFTPQSTSLS